MVKLRVVLRPWMIDGNLFYYEPSWGESFKFIESIRNVAAFISS